LPGAEAVPVIGATYPGFSVVAFNALIAPAGTPATLLDRISGDVRAVVVSPEFAERTKALGISAWGSTPEGTRCVVLRAKPRNGPRSPKPPT